MLFPRRSVLLLGFLLLLSSVSTASAQITSTQLGIPFKAGQRNNVAYDFRNEVYLAVSGWDTPVRGQFLTKSGAPIGGIFTIATEGEFSGWATVTYGGTDADPAFLVTYVVGTAAHTKYGRLIRYQGGSPSVSARSAIADVFGEWLSAEKGQSFWNGEKFVVGTRLPGAALPYPVTHLFDLGGGVTGGQPYGDSLDYYGSPAIACSKGSVCIMSGFAAGIPFGSTGATYAQLFDSHTLAPLTGWTFLDDHSSRMEEQRVVYNSSADRFLAAWFRAGWVDTRLVNTDGSLGPLTKNVFGNGVAGDVGLGYNSGTDTTLLVSKYATSTVFGLFAVELNSSGSVIRPDNVVLVTQWDGRWPEFAAGLASNDKDGSWLVLDTQTVGGRGALVQGTGGCSFTLPATSIKIGPTTAAATMTVTASSPTCKWTSVSNAGWIAVTDGASRTGTATVSFEVAASTTTQPRAGTMTIAGQTFTVSQAGVPCVTSINPTAIRIGSLATNGTIHVSATPPAGVTGECPWSATSNIPAAIIFQGASGRVNSGPLDFNVTTNTATTTRIVTATVAGQTFTMTQTGTPLDPATLLRENTRADFNGDGFNDLLWQDTSTGYLAAWLLNGGHTVWSAKSFDRVLDNNWRIVGTGDFTGDGKPDIVWHHQVTGAMYLWSMNGLTRTGGTPFRFGGEPDTRWKVVGVGDFNGDQKPDIVWQHDTGWLTVFLMDGVTLIESRDLSPARVQDTNWRIVGVADLNADGASDLIFQHSRTGELAGWIMNGTTRAQYVPFFPGAIMDLNWRLAAVLDVNGDQAPDLVWQNPVTGAMSVWYMTGTARLDGRVFAWTVGPNWMIVGPR